MLITFTRPLNISDNDDCAHVSEKQDATPNTLNMTDTLIRDEYVFQWVRSTSQIGWRRHSYRIWLLTSQNRPRSTFKGHSRSTPLEDLDSINYEAPTMGALPPFARRRSDSMEGTTIALCQRLWGESHLVEGTTWLEEDPNGTLRGICRKSHHPDSNPGPSGHGSSAVPTGLRRLADRDLLKSALGDAVTSMTGRRRHFEALTLRRNWDANFGRCPPNFWKVSRKCQKSCQGARLKKDVHF